MHAENVSLPRIYYITKLTLILFYVTLRRFIVTFFQIIRSFWLLLQDITTRTSRLLKNTAVHAKWMLTFILASFVSYKYNLTLQNFGLNYLMIKIELLRLYYTCILRFLHIML